MMFLMKALKNTLRAACREQHVLTCGYVPDGYRRMIDIIYMKIFTKNV